MDDDYEDGYDPDSFQNIGEWIDNKNNLNGENDF
jgi:hypothetical protein